MATVLVKNLPAVSTASDLDLLIVNVNTNSLGPDSGTTSGEYTTSNIKLMDLRATLNQGDNNFNGDVTVNGSVTITSADGQFVGKLDGNATGSAQSVVSLMDHDSDDLEEGTSNLYLKVEERAEIAKVADKADNVPGLNSENLLSQGDTVAICFDKIDTELPSKAPNIPTITSNNFLISGTTVGALFDQIDAEVVTKAPNVADKGSQNYIKNPMTVGQSLDVLDTQLGITAALAFTAVQPDDIGTAAAADADDFATSDQGETADTALQPGAIGVSVQGYDGNTVVDANYATVQSGAAAGATALQAVPNTYSTTAQANGLYAPIAAKDALDTAFGLGADLKSNFTTGELDDEAKTIAAINTTNAKINALIAALEIA